MRHTGAVMGWKIAVAAGLALGLTCAGPGYAVAPNHFSGKAAYYDKDYHDIVTAGGKYDPKKFTCAHLTLPLGTRVLITDVKTKRTVECLVNDRGPHSKKLIIDLSWAAALKLDMIKRGIIDVTVDVLPATAADAKQ